MWAPHPLLKYKKAFFLGRTLFRRSRRGVSSMMKSIFGLIELFISGQTCLTTNDSPDKNAECKFPWKFLGKVTSECTNEGDPDGK